MTEIGPRAWLLEAEFVRLVIRAAISAEHDIHERRDIGVVAGIAITRVMPVMQFRRADQHARRSERKTDVRVNIYGPDTAERDESGDSLQRKAQDHGGQIDNAYGINGVKRMLPVGGEPVEMFGTVVDCMKPP